MNKVLVCIPTYNERENIEIILNRLFASIPQIHALVIDDNSPDGTAAIVEELKSKYPNLHLLNNSKKSGLGGAYRAGFSWALENQYEYVAEMDADGSHQPEQLISLIEQIPSSDVVIGSRWTKGGSVVNGPLSRKFLSLGGNFYVRTVLGIRIKDATAGFRIYSRKALESLNLIDSQSQGYIFQADGTYRAVKLGLKVTEVPIEFVERTLGQSKMSSTIVLEAITQVTIWAFKHRILRKAID